MWFSACTQSLIFIFFWNSRNVHLGGMHFNTDDEVEEAVFDTDEEVYGAGLHFLRDLAGDFYD